jgi:superfamily II DNA helicase RecQ
MPDILLEKLKELLDLKKFRKRLPAVNFDGVHCVYQWGADFRKACDRLSHLHATSNRSLCLFRKPHA